MEQNKANGSAKNGPVGSHSNTKAKQRSLANLKPFKKGDKRINRSGRPKSFDQCRSLALQIAHEIKSGGFTTIEDILYEWAHNKDPYIQAKFVEVAYGKVPDKIETTGLENKTILQLFYDHERPRNEGDRRTSSVGIPSSIS